MMSMRKRRVKRVVSFRIGSCVSDIIVYRNKRVVFTPDWYNVQPDWLVEMV
jgi:hypothetical protein